MMLPASNRLLHKQLVGIKVINNNLLSTGLEMSLILSKHNKLVILYNLLDIKTTGSLITIQAWLNSHTARMLSYNLSRQPST